MAIRKFILGLAICIAAVLSTMSAQEIVRKAFAPDIPDLHETVIVGNDTVPLVLPERNYGRFNRGLYNYLFIPKGKWAFGLTASYGELNTDDIQFLSYIQDLDFSGKIYSIKPYISYFFRSNQSIGLRFNFTHGNGELGRFAVDFDDDIDFDIRDVRYFTESYSASLFYRNYIGLNRGKRFAIFNEVDVTVGGGKTRFKRTYDGKPKDTHTTITSGSINFSPGAVVFIQEQIAFNVSFGVFGLNFKNEKQVTDGVYEGKRFSSGANFRFNIFNINFGMMVVI